MKYMELIFGKTYKIFGISEDISVDYAKIIHEMYLRKNLLISNKLSNDTLNANDKNKRRKNNCKKEYIRGLLI